MWLFASPIVATVLPLYESILGKLFYFFAPAKNNNLMNRWRQHQVVSPCSQSTGPQWRTSDAETPIFWPWKNVPYFGTPEQDLNVVPCKSMEEVWKLIQPQLWWNFMEFQSFWSPFERRCMTSFCFLVEAHCIWLVVWNIFYFPIYWE